MITTPVHAHPISQNIFSWNHIPNKYLGKVDKQRLIRHNVFYAIYENVLGGDVFCPPAGVGLTRFTRKNMRVTSIKPQLCLVKL